MVFFQLPARLLISFQLSTVIADPKPFFLLLGAQSRQVGRIFAANTFFSPPFRVDSNGKHNSLEVQRTPSRMFKFCVNLFNKTRLSLAKAFRNFLSREINFFLAVSGRDQQNASYFVCAYTTQLKKTSQN